MSDQPDAMLEVLLERERALEIEEASVQSRLAEIRALIVHLRSPIRPRGRPRKVLQAVEAPPAPDDAA